jgi:hypothetical protein
LTGGTAGRGVGQQFTYSGRSDHAGRGGHDVRRLRHGHRPQRVGRQVGRHRAEHHGRDPGHRAHDDSGGWFGIGKENLTISEYPDNTNSSAGLPIDHDHNPSTPEIIDPDHAFELSENGLREEMGAPHSDHY